MTKATTLAPAAITPRADAQKAIKAAGKAAATMFSKAREAARIASADLNVALPLADRIKAVAAAYSAELSEAGHNVKAIFTDALTLFAVGQKTVEIDNGKTVTHTTAAKAVEASKHTLRAAAKAVRESAGIGRRAGGGRKAATATNAAATNAAADNADALSAWLDNLSAVLADPIGAEKFKARLIEAGYSLSKAPAGRKVTTA